MLSCRIVAFVVKGKKKMHVNEMLIGLDDIQII